jgi:amidophosphoribosyltransferase
MSDSIKHECAVALLRLLDGGENPGSGLFAGSSDPGGTALSLLLEKQHNRGQDGAGAAILSLDPQPGAPAYWMAKSASPTALADLLGMIGKRHGGDRRATRAEQAATRHADTSLVSGLASTSTERIFLGHLRYATYGRGDESFCHPFVHAEPRLERTLLLAGNFNLTNTHELFEAFREAGNHAACSADGYLICELLAAELGNCPQISTVPRAEPPILRALRMVLPKLDGAFTLCGMTGDGWAFAIRDAHGIRPGWYHISSRVVAVASERPAIQAAFDVPPEAVRELPPGEALLISPLGEVRFERVFPPAAARPCSFERIYFSRANDADIQRERRALGAALLPQVLEAAHAPLENIFFSYIPNSAQIAFHGLLAELFRTVSTQRTEDTMRNGLDKCLPRFGQIAVKDAKFRTFIADAAARREIGRHVYDVVYGLVRPGIDTLVVLDDSIVRGTTMRDAILPMLDRLGPKRIVVASSAPPIRYPDCYGIDMSTLGELVAFRALENLLGHAAEAEFRAALAEFSSHAEFAESAEFSSFAAERHPSFAAKRHPSFAPQAHPSFGGGCHAAANPLASLYARFTEEEHAAEIARMLTPPGMRAEVSVVYQTVADLRAACPDAPGDWYFTGDYPTPGGYRVLRRSLENHLARREGRSY